MKKKLLFKNATQYSKNIYDDFTRFHNNKFSLRYDIFTLFILILLLFCVIETIKAKVIFLSILFILIFIVFGVYRFFNPFLFYKKEVKKQSITKEKTYKFYFYENYFKIRDGINYDKIFYFNLYKVFETKKYFYLYLTKKYSFIIDKSGFSLGTSEEFSNFTKKKFLFKYSK